MWSVLSLYKLAIHSLVESEHLNSPCLECLTGLVKEDILNYALLRAKNKVQISRFLHPEIKCLNTKESTVHDEDLLNIGKCCKIRVLEMNPPVAMRFHHPPNLLNAMLSQLVHLVKLHLQKNDGMTDDVVATLVHHSRQLQEVDVSGCHMLTDCAAISLATLPKLQALNISQTQVSDEGIVAFSRGKCALSLTELALNSCENIKGQSFKYITKHCSNLRILGLGGCPILTGRVMLKVLSRKASTSLTVRICCNLPPSHVDACYHIGNIIVKLVH